MNRYLAGALVAGMLTASGAAMAHEQHGGAKHDEKAEQKSKAKADEALKTVEGEIVDLACFLAHGASGPKHQKCALDCIKKDGMPAGLLTKDGFVYLLVEDHSKKGAFAPVKDLAAETVKVTGKVAGGKGIHALIVQKVEKSKSK